MRIEAEDYWLRAQYELAGLSPDDARRDVRRWDVVRPDVVASDYWVTTEQLDAGAGRFWIVLIFGMGVFVAAVILALHLAS
jgi:hypothetical protein